MEFKYWLLNEMPLNYFGVQLHRPESEIERSPQGASGHFAAIDRANIQHPRTMQKLEQVLANRGWRFNILLYESDLYLNELQEEVEDFIAQNDIPTKGHITFVKNGSSGDVLTPWMILHTFGHALFSMKTPQMKSIQAALTKELSSLLSDQLTSYGQKLNPRDPQVEIHLRQMQLELVRRLLQFKSAKRAEGRLSVGTLGELIHELVAEYLWNGRIRIKPDLERRSTKLGAPYSYLAEPVKLAPERLEQFAAQIENLIKQALDQAVGKIIYDHLIG